MNSVPDEAAERAATTSQVPVSAYFDGAVAIGKGIRLKFLICSFFTALPSAAGALESADGLVTAFLEAFFGPVEIIAAAGRSEEASEILFLLACVAPANDELP